jgi:U3 small nucleolar RNA-associated protein 10
MSEKVRGRVTPTVNKIAKFIQGVISTNSDPALIPAGLKALKAIGSTVCAGEENTLADLIPSVLTLIKNSESSQPALSTLSSIS